MYKVGDVEYSFDSIKNQTIKREFVDREVYANVNSLASYILEKSYEDSDAPFSYDDITNFYIKTCPDCGTTEEFEEVTSRDLEVKVDEDADEDERYVCPVCGCGMPTEEEAFECCEEITLYKCSVCDKILEEREYERLDTEPQDIFEWYLVSDFLCDKLENHGECVIVSENLWGRGCSGQAILLDGVISDICFEEEILEGQQYEWSV